VAARRHSRALKALDLPDIDIRVLVRTGDTPPRERQAMRKRPPHIPVTTPESLYLLLTSDSGRAMSPPSHRIVDDPRRRRIQARSHLALSPSASRRW
jgi:ATP-dependent Lhr-like helicase